MGAPERYRTIRRIGVGGMAEIFEAVATGSEGFERRVAIKRMLTAIGAEDGFAKMFLDEARIASQMHHGNVVSVFDYGVVDGTPFQVLEYVDGTDAQRLLDHCRREGTPCPIDIALHLCTEVGHALSHVHGLCDAGGRPLGVVHRDVKPSNILVSWAGDVKLTDFGIALSKQRRQANTQVGTVKGTLRYMAPEQMLGGAVDARADVFALGCVLHALLLGDSPLQQDRIGELLLAGQEMPIPLGCDDDVAAILSSSLRASKVKRFATAEAFTQALGTALARRLQRDAKSRLREWLAPLRDQLAPHVSPLDQAVAFEIASTATAARSFAAVPASQALTRRESGSASPARRGRYVPAALAAAGVLAASAGVFAFTRPTEPPTVAPVPTAASPSKVIAPIEPAPAPTIAAVTTPEPKDPPHKVRPTRLRKKGPVEAVATAAPIAPAAPVAAEPMAAPPPPAPGTLKLKVNGEGTAKVTIDDVARGNLPYDFSFTLPPGAHRLRVERFGQPPEEHDITIEAGQVTVVPIQFRNH